MTRRKLQDKDRVRIFRDAGGICCVCNGKIDGKGWIVEHVIPLKMGGEDGGDNLKPAHILCAANKTNGKNGDLANIAKAKRREALHIGAKVKPRGFAPAEKQMRATKPIEKLANLGRRPMYERTDNG